MGMTSPDSIMTTAGSIRASPSPEMVQNMEIFMIVVSALLSNTAPQNARRNAAADATDGGASRSRNSPAITNMGIARNRMGAVRMAMARAYQSHNRFTGRTSS